MRRLLVSVGASLTLLASPMAAPGRAASGGAEGSLPLIASGVLPGAAGWAAAGRVELLAWPPLDQLEVGDEVTPVAVAAAPVGSDGRFALRAAPTPLLARMAAANGGYLNLEMRTTGGAGSSVTNFSRYLSPGGTWQLREDGPADLALEPEVPRVPMAYPFPACGPWKLAETTNADTVIGELQTEADTTRANFRYGKQADSDISVGMRLDGGEWVGAGTHHTANKSRSEVVQNASHGDSYLLSSSFEYGRFRCSYSADEQTRALGWRGHTLVEYPITGRGCTSANPDFVARFGRDQEFHRESEKAESYSQGAEAFGFSYGTRSGYSQWVRASWYFGSGLEHLICGNDNGPHKSSRVFAGPSVAAEPGCRVGRPC